MVALSFFKTKPENTATAQATASPGGGNPYLNGREEWLERYGSYISRAAQWRMVAFFCLIQAEIAACISNWRTVTADVELQQKMIERLSFFMAGSAKGVLREWYEANNPYEIAKSGKLVHVEIKGLPLPVSSDSYRVEWVETVRSHAGVLLDSHAYEATVTIQINPPTVDAVLLRNPGGVYITSLSAGKVVGVQTPAAPVNPNQNEQ